MFEGGRAANGLLRLELEAASAGRYEILRELGQGGMAVVFLGRDVALQRLVAIKVLPPDLARLPAFRERFVRETQTVASFSHPNIVSVHAIEMRDSVSFFVMAFVEGESLARRIERSGPLPVFEVSRILREITWALGYAHSRGVIHGDVKPDNILLEHASGRAMLTDFGIAQVAQSALQSSLKSSLTEPGAGLGTPDFMSPEQIFGEPLDGRSDLYSLGVVGFQALTGRLPFDASSAQSVLMMHLSRPAPPVGALRSETPRALARAIDRCLAKDPSARFETADALIAALPALSPGQLDIAPPVRNFQRAATLAVSQIFLLALGLPALALLQPRSADVVVAVLVFAVLAIVLQLRGRAQLLLATGYSYLDFRAAVIAEQRARAEEVEAFREAWGRRSRIPHWSFWLAILVGAGLVARGLIRTAPPGLSGLELMVGLGVAGAALVAELVGSPRRRRGLGSLSARFWVSRLGRALFRVLGSAHPLPLRERPHAAPSILPSATWERLSLADRRAWEILHRTMGDLETARDQWLRNEQAIDQAIESASRNLRGAPIPTREGDSAPGPQTDGAVGLLERQRELIESMRISCDELRVLRERADMMLDILRLQVDRLRAGIGSADAVQHDVAVARELLASSSRA